MTPTRTDSTINPTLRDRVLALAGLVQALAQVRQIAETGQADASVVSAALDSVFRVEASSTEAVFGGAHALRPGLMLLRDYLDRRLTDEQLPRITMSVLQLERRFVQDEGMVARVQRGIRSQQEIAANMGSAHPEVIAALGGLYADTLSHLRPRVLVQGNPHYLGQASIVAEVRAVLLAAVRAAVLWRQLGGSLWDFLLRRRDLASTVRALLG